ncbi:MAG: Na/Pi symporter [Candidatus Carbobacillus sp.]|nr:Na/Pi symporter [Candidatus Carbobacillus sp.]
MIMTVVSFVIGLTLFFLGLRWMQRGLKAIAGDHIQGLLKKATHRTWQGFFIGLFLTAFLGSSSVVTILIVALVQSGWLSFQRSIALIIGANVGTSLTLYLFTLPLEKMYPYVLSISWLFYIFGKHKVKYSAQSVGGLVLAQMALQIIASGARHTSNLLSLLPGYNPSTEQFFPHLIFGTILATIIQSSTASVLLAGAWLTQGVWLETSAVAFIIGANIGTCSDTLLASLSGGREGKRVAWAHLGINVIGAILIYPFMNVFTQSILAHSPTDWLFVAHAQLAYNLLSALFFLPWTKLYAAFIEKLYP